MRYLLTFTYILTLAFAYAPASSAAPSGSLVLKRMLASEGSRAYVGTQVTTLAADSNVTSEQKVARYGYKGMRMEYLSPQRLKGEVIADNGKVIMHYIPSRKVVRTHPSRLAMQRQRLMQMSRGNLKAKLVGSDRIAGRSAYVIEVSPVRSRVLTRKFWVDTATWVKLKTEDIGPNGAVISTSYFKKIKYVPSIPASMFKVNPPDGVRVKRGPASASRLLSLEQAQDKAGFRVLSPSYLPPGFRFAGATVTRFRGDNMVAVRYTDGMTSFSIMQVPDNALKPRFQRRLRGGPERTGAGYSWKQNGISLTIIGRIPYNQITNIADSVK